MITPATGIYRVRVRNERWNLCDRCAKWLQAIDVVVERLRRIGGGEHEECRNCKRAAGLLPLSSADHMP